MLNFSANMLGLSNAATPMGLKAMSTMQELNPDKERASNSMIMFLALNTAGFTLIPVSIMAIRGIQGAKDPTDVFVPILMTSFCTTMFALVFVALRQRIRIWEPKLLAFLVLSAAFMFGIVRFFMSLSSEERANVSSVAGNMIIFGIVVAFLVVGMIKRQNVFEGFIEGAKDGFQTAVRIIPYLVGLIVAIGMFRASGAMDYVVAGCTWFFQQLGVDTRFTPALPVAFMKPLSGGGTESLAIDLMKANGADSFVGRMASVMYASADTTFYIVALYFGSIGVKRTRYAVGAGLLVDLAGITAAILFSYLFWG
jgi:spore maturation protein SpmB